jgi:hypothetical protein
MAKVSLSQTPRFGQVREQTPEQRVRQALRRFAEADKRFWDYVKQYGGHAVDLHKNPDCRKRPVRVKVEIDRWEKLVSDAYGERDEAETAAIDVMDEFDGVHGLAVDGRLYVVAEPEADEPDGQTRLLVFEVAKIVNLDL